MVREIGSIWPLYDKKLSEFKLVLKDNRVNYLSLCREALNLTAVLNSHTNKTVLVPAYSCSTVYDPFISEGWNCVYYNISKDLRIDIDSILSLYKEYRPGLCVIHPYYGVDLNNEELDAVKYLKTKGCIMVKDITQCIFSDIKSDGLFDYYVGSFRKWCPIPDGAFVFIVNNNNSFDISNLQENLPFVQLQSDAMYLRGVYNECLNSEIKEISRRIAGIAYNEVSRNFAAHRISDFSMCKLLSMDFSEIKRARRENYKYLFDNIKSKQCKAIHSIDQLKDGVPLYFPMYVENRSEFQQMLAQNGIYAPVLWPIASPEILISDDIKYIYSSFLAVPCDQRYNLNDMQRIVEIINQCTI